MSEFNKPRVGMYRSGGRAENWTKFQKRSGGVGWALGAGSSLAVNRGGVADSGSDQIRPRTLRCQENELKAR